MTKHSSEILQTADSEWITFPGGELEGRRPNVLCPSCRGRLQEAARLGAAPASRQPLCFQCYRTELDRERALIAAGELDTATEARFQGLLPLETVNRPRLERLKAVRTTERLVEATGAGRFADRRHQAQIAARRALEAIGAGLRRRDIPASVRDHLMGDAIHAAELQLPEAWLPFVVSC
ncbi:MAG: hypothetical protein ABI868_05455 [Acidobacteriota bacterium]